MKKRLFSILLILCMVLVMTPTVAFAEGETPAAKTAEVDTAEALSAAVAAGGMVKLMEDIDISASLTINGIVTLDLNGYVLKMTTDNTAVVVAANGSLTLVDSNPTKEHKFTPSDDGLWALDEENGTKTVNGGVITGGSDADGYGGGVFVYHNGTFIMQAGNIVGCTAIQGGGVCVSAYENGSNPMEKGIFKMSGGTITGCTAKQYEQNDYVWGGGIASWGDIELSGTAKIQSCRLVDTTWVYGGSGICSFGGIHISGDVIVSDCTTYIVTNSNQSSISGGTFDGTVEIDDGNKLTITGGTFNLDVTNTSGTITGGIFNGKVTNYFWHGEEQIKMDGLGTEANPYQIGNANQLKLFRDIVNGTNQTQNTAAWAELTADIVLNDGTFDEDGNYTAVVGSAVTPETWTPIGYIYMNNYGDDYSGSPYTGTFDGQGHTIRGLYVDIKANGSYRAPTGLFGYTKNAAIRNLTVTGFVLDNCDDCGGIAGWVDGGRIENCGNQCNIKSTWDNFMIGGIVGRSYSASVIGCYNTGKINAEERAGGGGIVGDANDSTIISDCYNAGAVSGLGYTGGIVGISSRSALDKKAPEISNCYSIGTVTGVGDVGSIVDWNYGIVKNCYFLNSATDKAIGNNFPDKGGSVDEATGPKPAADFADGTVLKLLKDVGRTGNDPWADECQYVDAAGMTLPVFEWQKGKLHDHGDKLKHVEAKAATTGAEGNIEHWYCETCGKYFSDAGAQNEITQADTVISKLQPSGSSYNYYTIQASVNANGSITPSGKVSVREGSDQTFTITPDQGYDVADVKIDGKSIGAVRSYTFEKVKGSHTIEVEIDREDVIKQAKAEELTASIVLTARSVKTAKKNVKVRLEMDAESAAAIRELQALGYTVKYKFYRSEKKAWQYEAKLTKTSKVYVNTQGEKGKRYYYKARVLVYDQNGRLVTYSKLTQCKYAARLWTK